MSVMKNKIKLVLAKMRLLKTANRVIMGTKNLIKNVKIFSGVKVIDATYTKTFYRNNIKMTDKSAEILIKELINLYPKIDSVLDLGCGNGLYLDKFIKSGITNVVGIDGSINAKKESVIDEKYITIGDLSKNLNLIKSFYFTECIEVAEHLPAEFADILVDNVCSSGSEIILFTAAKPGQ